MEFNKGDKVVRNDVVKQSGEYGITTKDAGVMEVEDINSENNEIQLKVGRDNGGYWVDEKYFELANTESNVINSKSLQKTMEKKIYKVLAVNKKTSAVEKDEVVVAVNEQSAILKAFGVDAENVFIKTTEEGSYTEDKPVTAVLVKETKTPKENKTPK